MRPARQQAFTLLELMVVLVLIGLTATLILPAMRGSFEHAVLRSTARTLIDACQLAGSRAVTLQQTCHVRLDPQQHRFAIECLGRPAAGPGLSGPLDARVAIQLHHPSTATRTDRDPRAPNPPIDPGASPAPAALTFHPDGTADPAEILLRDPSGTELVLRIVPATGRVRLLATGNAP